MSDEEIVTDIIRIGMDYEDAWLELRRATELVGGDDVKVDMIRHLHPRFEALMVWHEGMGALISSKSTAWAEIRAGVFEDMRKHSIEVRALAAEFRRILEPLQEVKHDLPS